MGKQVAKRPYAAKLKLLPDQPGVYKFMDSEGKVIYIGKAKSLKKRVSSYFNKQQYENRKTKVLVSKIHDVNVTVVPSEVEALLLENSLIKEFQPRYNINLKDDKSFPLVKISTERFPKIFAMRNPVNDGSAYFGPFASVRTMHTVLDLCKRLYPIRNCNLHLSQKNIEAGKFKVCMEYQIGNCKGPCEGFQSEEDYMESIQHIKHILRGNLREVKDHLKQQMETAAGQWNYEEAARLKDKLEQLQNYQSRSTVVNQRITDTDVLNIHSDLRHAYVNYMRIANGMVIQSRNYEIKKQMDEPDHRLLASIFAEVRSFNQETHEILVPCDMELDGPFVIPKGGDKLKLLELSKKNALWYAKEKTRQYERLDPSLRTDRLMRGLQDDLRLKEAPLHMECFDNSNTQGHFPVAACVVFRNGKPAKKEYRHFNIKTVEGPDDFASMREVIGRRYGRMIKEGEELPQLVIVDGGKGQLSAAVEALKELGIYGKLAVIGIAKRLEEIYYPEDPLPLYIDKKSQTLKVIQQMRDEAHRFGITHHRNRRSKGTIISALTQIKGIGSETASLLLREFKTVNKVKKSTEAELSAVVGPAKAKLIRRHFDA